MTSLAASLRTSSSPAPPSLRGTRAGSRHLALPAAITAVFSWAAVTFGDWITGADVTCTLLYLGPIWLAVWLVGRPCGVTITILSALATLVLRLAEHRADVSRAALAWNVAGEIGVFLVVTYLLDALRKRLDGATMLARIDPLTKLLNRRALEEALEEVVDSGRRSRAPLTLAYVDVDDFKQVNDTLGHAAGDAVLAEVAGAIASAVRGRDTVARMGGDEFAIVLPETDGEVAEALVERLRVSLVPLAASGITASIGTVTFTETPADAAGALAAADRLMYCAKRAGRGRVTSAVVAGAS